MVIFYLILHFRLVLFLKFDQFLSLSILSGFMFIFFHYMHSSLKS